MQFWSLYLPEAASTKEVSLFISIACLNASSNVLMYEFFFAIFLSNLSRVLWEFLGIFYDDGSVVLVAG